MTTPTPTKRSSKQLLITQAQLFSHEELYRKTLEELEDAVLVVNDSHEIVFANDAFVELTGFWSRSKLLGRRVGEALGCWRSSTEVEGCGASEHCECCGAAQALQCAQRGHEAATHEYRLIHQITGEAREFRARARTIEVSSQQFVMMVLRNIAHEKRREVLERVFLHDLANTLSSLSLATQFLKTEGLDEHHALIGGIASRLLEDVRAQKALAMAERGELVVEPKEIDLSDLLRNVQKLFDQTAEASSQNLVVALDDPQLTVSSDEALLTRIIGNMLKNAIEASTNGSTITLGAQDDGEKIDIWVQNPGLIPREVQTQIFHRSFSTKGRGRGIGSYSMKLLGESYLDGEVSFTSSEESGTRFSIRLPRSSRP